MPSTSTAPPQGAYASWRSLAFVAVASASAVALTRLATAGERLWTWDSVNFALALANIDISHDQPHPPGYLGYVMLARVLGFGALENVALLRVGLLASTLTAVMTWRLAERLHGSRAAAWTAWTLVVFSPLHWFYGSVAEIYTAETAITVAIAYAAYAICREDRKAPLMMALAVFAGLLVKSPAVVLMGPLVAYAFIKASASMRLLSGLSLATAATGAIVALHAIESLGVIFTTSFTGESWLLANLNAAALNRSARDVAYATIAALGAGAIAVFALGRPSTARHASFFAMWTCGYAVTCLLVHFPKPGYLLPLLPALAVVVCAPATRRSPAAVLSALAVAACVNTAQFAILQPFPAASVGDGLRYADKSLVQKVRTELNSMMRPSWHAIRTQDDAIAHVLDTVESGCRAAQTLVVVQPGGAVTWRHAMFYLRDATVVQAAEPGSPTLAARSRAMSTWEPDAAPMEAECVVIVEGAVETAMRGRGSLSWHVSAFPGQTVSVSPTPVELRLDGENLRLAARREATPAHP